MESLSETTWDVIICGTGLQQSLLALSVHLALAFPFYFFSPPQSPPPKKRKTTKSPSKQEAHLTNPVLLLHEEPSPDPTRRSCT